MSNWKEFRADVWKHWGRLMTGSLIVALVLAVTGAILQGPAFLSIFFVVLFVCLAVAFFKAWQEQSDSRKKAESLLERRGLTSARRTEAKRILAECSNLERNAIGRLLILQPMHGNKVREEFSGVDFMRLMTKTPFLFRDGVNDLWNIQSDWQDVLIEYFDQAPAHPA
jgi:hypothetical protein